MGKFQDIQAENKLRRERILAGKFNCLPFPFVRFRKIYPGVEQGKFLILTANQKIGKSKLADYLFIYEPLFFIAEHPELKVKVLYLSLEMSAKEKYNEFLCHLLFRLDNIHIDTRTLRSVDKPCDPAILALLETERYQKYIRLYEEMVLFNDTDKNPTGIKIWCENYALDHGHLNYVTFEETNELGVTEEKKYINPLNPYSQDDEEEYRFIIMDNAANVTTEKGCDTDRDAIKKVCKDAIHLKKRYKYIYVLIQHQAQSQEGIENIKLDRMMPTTDGLGDFKASSRDINAIIGLYNPAKFNKKIYLDYNIERLKNYSRFLSIIEDRDYGAAGNICPLFFDGATSTFKELPLPTETEKLEAYYQLAEYWESRPEQEPLQLSNPK